MDSLSNSLPWPAAVAPSRWRAFVLSAILHAAIAGWGLWLHGYLQDDAAYPGLKVVMLPKVKPGPDQIIWFPRAAAIPDLAPAQPFGPVKTPQGIRDPSGQTLIAHSPEPKSIRQFIWQPEHPQPLPSDIPTPNLVTLAQPAPALPKAPLRAFVPPPAPQPKSDAKPVPDLLFPPDSTRGPLPVDTTTLQQLLPQIPTSVAKPAPKLFVLPSPRQNGPAGPAQLPEAPSLPSRLGPQPGGSAASSLQAVVAGLNPAPGPLPEGSRSAEFARAPVAGAPSSGTSAAKPGTPAVPGLLAHNANGKPGESASPADTAKIHERFLVKEASYAAFNRTLSVPLRPSSRVIPVTVEALFAHRNVYTLVIPKPDLPEYSDDWVLWFSERQPGDTLAPRISAPVPARKYSLVGGAPAASLPANGTFQLAAVVERNGRISAARILRGTAGDAFRRKALEELEAWEFQPALRNGEAIDVDIVVEISLQLGTGPQQAR